MDRENRNRKSWYSVLGSFLARRWAGLLLFLVCAGIFALVFSLYDLELEAVLYAGGLCLLLLLAVLAADFCRSLARRRRYEEIFRNLPLLPEELPATRTEEEADLQEILKELGRRMEAALTEWENWRQESMDYYTTWVHQIKTPISVMRMTLEGEDTEEHRELSAELFRIEQYVEMVLSYLRLDSDSSDYAFQEYDLVTGGVQYSYLVFSAMKEGDSFRVSREGTFLDADKIVNLYVITLDEYNGAASTNASLSDGEIILYDSQGDYDASSLKLFDREYQVKAVLEDFPGKSLMAANIASSYFLVVPDQQEMDEIYAKQKEALTDIASEPDSFYAFDTDADQEEQRAFAEALLNLLQNGDLKSIPDSRVDADAVYLKLYGGFFFLGLFLGVLFLIAAVLIIYYKQISEGFEDRERFAIMRKVGLSRREVRSAIRSQVLTVFFLPLLTAGIHVAAAFPLMSRLLELLYLSNTRLYMACTAVSFLVFAVFYVIVYLLTARTYYRIVSR